MANDTVVQYLLKVDAAGAQKALESTAKEATQASNSLDRIAQSSKGATQGMKQTASAIQFGTKQARNFRRAGRDLDGALGDLAQGIGHLSPQLGSFIMEASDGVSIVEGLGRSFTLFLNPAVLAAGAVAVVAGGSFAFMGHEAEQARQEEEELAKALDEATRILEEQEKIIQDSAQALIGYSHEVDQARINLQLLTGQITQFEVDQQAATATAEEFGRKATEAQQAQVTAIQDSINARTEEISQLRQKIALLKEERAVDQSLSQRIAGEPQQFEEATFEETQAQKRLDTLKEAQKEDRERLQTAEEQRVAISGQQRELEQILKQTAEIKEQERQRAATEKARIARKRKEAAEQRDAEREQQRALKAQDQIQQILEKSQFAQLDKVGQINANYDKQAAKLFDLAETSGDIEGANAALVELTKLRNQLLDEEQAKQDEIEAKEAARAQKEADRIAKAEERRLKEAQRTADIIRKQGEQQRKEAERLKKETDLIVKSINAIANITSDLFIKPTGQLESMLRKVENIRSTFQNIREEGLKEFAQKGISNVFKNLGDAKVLQRIFINALQKISVIASLDASAIVGLVSPLAGTFTSLVQSIGERLLDPEQGPEEIRKQALAQAEAIKVGIAFLPELLLSIAPQLGIAIAEAFVDGIGLFFINLINNLKDTFSFFRNTTADERRKRFAQQLEDFLDPRKSASFMGGGRFVPSAQGGIRFTGMKDGLAMLHRGEFVVPQSGQRPQQVERQLNRTTGGAMTININSAVVDRNAVDALVREIEIRFNNQFGTSSSSLFGGR